MFSFAGTAKKADQGGYQVTAQSYKIFKHSEFKSENPRKNHTQDLVYRHQSSGNSVSLHQFFVPVNDEPSTSAYEFSSGNPTYYKEMRQREYLYHLFPSHFFW